MIKRTSSSGTKNKNISNKEVSEELHKSIIKKVKKRKAQLTFIDNVWGAGLSDVQLLSKLNIRIRFLLYVIDIYSKYAWVIPLKDKKGIAITNAFQKVFKLI